MLSIIRPRLLFLLLLCFANCQSNPALAVGFNASWLYRQTGGEGRETQEEFQQRYNLGAGTGFTYQPTQAITAGATIGYTRTHRDHGEGMITTDELTPAAHLGILNDIFSARFSASTSGFSSSDSSFDETSRFWDASVASNWVIPFWPSLRFNYSELNEPMSGVITENRGAGLDWNLLLAQLFYQYSNTRSENEKSGGIAESDSHFARIESKGRFWDNRASISFAQQFQYSTQDFAAGSLGEESFALQVEGQATVRIDPATDLNPLNPTDPGYDDPAEDLPRNIDLNERAHLRFATGSTFSETLDYLRLTFGSVVEARDAESLIWSLYFRRSPLDQWEQLPGTLSGSIADGDDNSIDIRLGVIQAAEILMVASNDSAAALTLTRVEAFSQPSDDVSSSTTSYLTNLGGRVRLTSNLTASASLMKEHQETESGDAVSENDRQTVSGGLRWTPAPYVIPSMGFSESRQEQTGGAELLNRSYSLTVVTIPLQTMNVSFGATSYRNYRDELKTAFGTRYNLTTNARIYPDLNAALFLSYSDDERLTSDGLAMKSNTLTSRLNLNAQLSRALTAGLISGYAHREQRGGGTFESADATFSLAYRPSTFLSMRGAYSTLLFGDGAGADRLALGLTLALLRTQNTRLTFNANHSQTDSRKTESFTLDGSWDISRNLSLQAKANYLMGTRDSYGIQGFLTLRL
jgi:hypothetical protein